MKRKLTIATLLALAVTAGAQRITVAKATVDCGKTGYEQPVTAVFELRNKGLKRLKIERVLPDCNCTRVEYPREEIGIGDRFTIRMTYDARTLGHFNKQAAVVSNGSKKPLYLTMTGVVLTDLKDYSDSYPYDLGDFLVDKMDLEFDDVNQGERPVQEIGCMNNGTADMQPTVMHLPPYLTAVVEPEVLRPGKSGRITFTLQSDRLHDFGLTQSSVYLAKHLGEKVQRENEVPISVVLLPKPSTVALDEAPELAISTTDVEVDFAGKSKKTVEVIVYNAGRSRLDISSLQMFTPGLRVTLGKRQLAAGETTKLKLTAYADALRTARSKPRVLMITNDPRKAKVVITVNVK